jgi:hypothetical protein
VVKDVALSAEALTGRYAEADLTKDEALAKVMTADASGTEVEPQPEPAN